MTAYTALRHTMVEEMALGAGHRIFERLVFEGDSAERVRGHVDRAIKRSGP
jgi:hypothetical protein